MNGKIAYTQNDLLGLIGDYKNFNKLGVFKGELNFKMWGRDLNLFAFFTLDNGDRIKLSCKQSQDNKDFYSANDGRYNFAIIGNEGLQFHIIMAEESGKVIFDSAIPIVNLKKNIQS